MRGHQRTVLLGSEEREVMKQQDHIVAPRCSKFDSPVHSRWVNVARWEPLHRDLGFYWKKDK